MTVITNFTVYKEKRHGFIMWGIGPCLKPAMVFLGKGTFRKYPFLVRSSRPGTILQGYN